MAKRDFEKVIALVEGLEPVLIGIEEAMADSVPVAITVKIGYAKMKIERNLRGEIEIRRI